jgi:DNA-binding Xre family transcriptional regulator
MANEAMRLVTESLAAEAKRLGKRKVAAAIAQFSRRVIEIAERAKQRMFEEALEEVVLPIRPLTKPELSAQAADTRIVAERASKRQAVVMPILRNRRWKRGRLVTESGLGKNSVYRFLDGTRASITAQNRQAIADALGLKPEDLPD